MTILLEFDGVRAAYGATVALDGVSLQVAAGELVGVVGANGAGKSTLLRIACGQAPQDGRVVRFGVPSPTLSREAATQVGVLLEDSPAWPELFVFDALKLSGALRRVPRSHLDERVGAVIVRCGLAAVAGARVDALSRGYRQRLGWALALLHGPALLILDEPTTGLDDAQEEAMWALLAEERARGAGALLSTHALERLAEVDRIVVLDAGRIVATLAASDLGGDVRATIRTRVEHARNAMTA
jgi:ABC-2 type transport system ATP-binding protein